MNYRLGSIQDTQDREGNVGAGFNLLDESGALITLFLFPDWQSAANAKGLMEAAIAKAISISAA
jgi:hypothetical protein